MGKKILKDIKFQFKDCIEYKFTIKENNDDKNRFDLCIYKSMYFTFYNYKFFRYYKLIIDCESYGVTNFFRTIEDYSNIIIEQICQYNKRYNHYEPIQNLFKTKFDGYIGLTEDEKKSINRTKTIKTITK